MNPLQIDPREYQLGGARFLVRAKKAVLADEMGIGKTGTAALAWREVGLVGPALLIGRPAAQSVWIQQAAQWGIQAPLTITGTAKQRAELWKDVDKYSFVACTIQTLRNDRKSGIAPKKWGTVFYDEAHRISNRKSKGFETVRDLECEYLWLLTGSPMRKGFWDLWALLYLCDRKAFSSYWRYVQTFGYTMLNEHGAWEVTGLRDREGLARRISPYFIRREKRDVLPELPAKQRILDRRIPELQPEQGKQYRQMEDDLIAELSSGDIIVAQSQLVKLLRLRQMLCTPKILDPDFPEWGASLEYLGEMLEETEDCHFVVYTPFAQAIPHIAEFLRQRLRSPDIFEFRGGVMSPQQIVNKTIDFRATRGQAICSIAFAESFELVPAEWAYFNGFSWDVTENVQAEDRQHRMTTTASISYYYPMHIGGVDLLLMEPVLHQKAKEILYVHTSHRSLREALIRSRQSR